MPGGRSHSASDRAGLFNANARAQKLGAAMVINVMAVPGNGQFQPEGGLRNIPQITVSQDEGFALRDRLGAGEKVTVTLQLDAPEVTNVQTAWTMATLPGASEEQIVVMTHTDGYFQAATDNNSGMAGALELARHYAAMPQPQRPRGRVDGRRPRRQRRVHDRRRPVPHRERRPVRDHGRHERQAFRLDAVGR